MYAIVSLIHSKSQMWLQFPLSKSLNISLANVDINQTLEPGVRYREKHRAESSKSHIICQLAFPDASETLSITRDTLHTHLYSPLSSVIEKVKSSGEKSHMGYLVTLLKGLLSEAHNRKCFSFKTKYIHYKITGEIQQNINKQNKKTSHTIQPTGAATVRLLAQVLLAFFLLEW